MKDTDYKILESIEESLMRQVYQTGKRCSIHLLYLQGGQIPVRYVIQNMKLMFLHYILQQKEDSLLLKFFNAQCQFPSKGDWVTKVKFLLEYFNIGLTMEEIKHTKKKILKKNGQQMCTFEGIED